MGTGMAWLLDLGFPLLLPQGQSPVTPGVSAGAWRAEMGVTGGVE